MTAPFAQGSLNGAALRATSSQPRQKLLRKRTDMTEKLILASGSPRRREILTMAGYQFTVLSPDADESAPGLSPAELVQELSRRKAAAATAVAGPRHVILAADTVVALDEKILGKPKNAAHAAEMLSMLSGRTHTVYTGFTICGQAPAGKYRMQNLLHDTLSHKDKDTTTSFEASCVEASAGKHPSITHAVAAQVTMRDITKEEINAYVATGSPLDKAGAYGIQEAAGMFIQTIQGDYYSIMGLPICPVSVILRDTFGIVPVPQKIQREKPGKV